MNEAEIFGIKVVNEITESIFNGLDLVVECAQASVLSDHLAKSCLAAVSCRFL